MKLSSTERLELIKQVGEEIIGEKELVEKLENNDKLIAYDGFEPSGQIHIAQGLLRAINVNKLNKAGIKMKFWVADWFAMMNNKMGGDLDKIRDIGNYFIEVWKAVGMDVEDSKKVEFIWASESIKDHPEYWETVLKLSQHATVQRILRCGQIMGREESTSNPASQIMYPLMQAADIHHLNADIAQLGMDQRKVNMLARDVFPKIGLKAPIAIHHHMLMGLGEPQKKNTEKHTFGMAQKEKIDEETEILIEKKLAKKRMTQSLWETVHSLTGFNSKEIENDVIKFTIFHKGNEYPGEIEETEAIGLAKIGLSLQFEKSIDNFTFQFTIRKDATGADAAIAKKMSKSNPNSAIFMTDTTEDINKKFKKAFCPEGESKDNPVLEYCKYIIFEKLDGEKFLIERPDKFGGNAEYATYEELEKAFIAKEVHPMDLKVATAKYIDKFLEPVREHFENNKEAKDLLEKVKSYIVTK